ncbi:hypothetical protein N22_025 [Idiomarinaceae phage 1N2-2]|uniref:hypothetical protein n=1 Tax=Idiomarinaceae phage 1N2-2 TaxID=1536592 RepID=UPI0004F84A9F|nr:hypothetical protein N22_025 [Idiomarinaceae phage 1N2-2]AIM40727.1 hypothetical protein N22_025 [Idiomarinaceae phage 1N2-2]
MTDDLRDRVSRMEGFRDASIQRMDGMDKRFDMMHSEMLNNFTSVDQKAEKAIAIGEQNAVTAAELTDALAQAKGAYNGFKFSLYIFSGLLGLGIISVTFGG